MAKSDLKAVRILKEKLLGSKRKPTKAEVRHFNEIRKMFANEKERKD
jgi:hypothetical protein